MSKAKGQTLSPRHISILEFLEIFQAQNGYPPTIRDIGERCDISSTSVVNYYLNQLAAMGYLVREKGVSRGLRLLKAFTPASLRRIPLLGRIRAGLPLPLPPADFNYFDAESALEIPASLLPGNLPDLFALEVQGDSMIDALVNEGDLVILRPVETAQNGDMVAALVDGETTLKYFYLEGGRVRLQPANPAYAPIYVDQPDTLRLQGQVVMVIRRPSA